MKKINEAQLRKIIAESVKKALSETVDSPEVKAIDDFAFCLIRKYEELAESWWKTTGNPYPDSYFSDILKSAQKQWDRMHPFHRERDNADDYYYD